MDRTVRTGVVLTITLSLLALSMMPLLAVASPERPEAEAPLCEVYLEMEPEEIDIFPTYEGSRNLFILGRLTVDKYRPGNIIVNINTTLDIDWFFTPDHHTIPFDHVGTHVAFFTVTVSLPPHTMGPITARLDVRVYLSMASVYEEDTAFTVITVMPRSDEYLVNMPPESMAPNGMFDGKVTVYNLHDEELEFHLCALGEWAELMPDLDFQGSVVLASHEILETRFHGEVSDEVEEGSHRVEIGLWTPGPGEERIFVTIKNVTIHVEWDAEGLASIFVRFALPLIVMCVLTVAGVAYYIQRRNEGHREVGL